MIMLTRKSIGIVFPSLIFLILSYNQKRFDCVLMDPASDASSRVFMA